MQKEEYHDTINKLDGKIRRIKMERDTIERLLKTYEGNWQKYNRLNEELEKCMMQSERAFVEEHMVDCLNVCEDLNREINESIEHLNFQKYK